MPLPRHELVFKGGLLSRGFWLYVWEITPPTGRKAYYVGRTGDSSSTNAQSPFNRMGQHLGFAKNSSMLRNHQGKRRVLPEVCAFRLVAVGPIEAESTRRSRREHDIRRNLVAAMECELARLMIAAGYEVMNTVTSRERLDVARFRKVRSAFEASFPQIANVSTAALH